MKAMLIVVLFWSAPSGEYGKERHEYPFPDLASCERAAVAVVSNYREMTTGWLPQGIAAWCKL